MSDPALPGFHYVYLLRSKDSGRIYLGCTNDLTKRFKAHCDGKVFSTKHRLPIDLLYYEAYRSKDDAFRREKRLKFYGSSLSKLRTRLSETLKKEGRDV